MRERWKPSERAARIANGFERQARPIHVDIAQQGQPPAFGPSALHEAYELGRRDRR